MTVDVIPCSGETSWDGKMMAAPPEKMGMLEDMRVLEYRRGEDGRYPFCLQRTTISGI